MYLDPKARGKGIGRILIDKCIAKAKEVGYDRVYLESLPELKVAVAMYEKYGFKYLDTSLGNSGHSGCNVWMIRNV
jgi:putative acetyltransferase